MDKPTLKVVVDSLFEALKERLEDRPVVRLALPAILQEAQELETLELTLRLYEFRQKGESQCMP